MSSNPSAVSVECTAPDSTQWKIVREFTCAKSAASSTLNISTWREQAVHQAVLLCRLTTINLSVSTVISVRVLMGLYLEVDDIQQHAKQNFRMEERCRRHQHVES